MFYMEIYPCIITVRVSWPDGDYIFDCIKGNDVEHALIRAKANWEEAQIELNGIGELV